VIPVFGPRTARDTVGLVLDVAADPVTHVQPIPARNVSLVVRAVNDRANLLPADKVVEEAALDKYSYIRDAYLQRRRNLIYDGNAPRESEADADQVERPVTAEAGTAEPQASATSVAPAAPVLVARTETTEAK
jgi:phospholipid-binding lipoprotein MlaA